MVLTEATPQRSHVAICTLWEKDLHKGVAILVNSLVEAGFKGTIWSGYRGSLPSWAQSGEIDGSLCTIDLDSGIRIVFLQLETPVHFAQYKAALMKRVLNELDPMTEGVYYFDPDIMVLAPWHFFEQWIRFGIAVCEDQSHPLNPTHPLVRGWQRYAEGLGFIQWNPPGVYFNSGLVGVSRDHAPFLDLWDAVLEASQRDFKLGEVMKMGSRTDLFHQTDQDALVVASAISPYPISWVGTDGMAFDRGEWLTLHALVKPWRRRIFRDLLVLGHRPDSGLRQYWRLARGPIAVESAARIKRFRFYIPLAALLSRFYSRP